MVNHLSFSRISLNSFASLLVFLSFADSCIAASHGAKNLADSTPFGWETVCMGRMLVDLPAGTQLADAKLDFESVYAFNGIANVETWGKVKWGSANLTETLPANRERLQNIASGAKRDLLDSEAYAGEIAARRKDVAYWEQKAKSDARPGEVTLYKKLISEKEGDVQSLIFASKVTGVAKSIGSNEFAVRPLIETYAVGFWEEKDRRIRTFSGELTDTKLDSPEAANEELRRWRSIYEARLPTEIPSGPGYCSSFGFFKEEKGPDVNAEMKIPFRLKQYPNLLFYLEAKPSHTPASASIYDFPDMAVSRAHLDVIGIKHRKGPSKVQILGTPGRIYAQEYGPNCASKNDCRPADQAYEIHAETLGEVGRVDRPHLTLYMVAATSDEYKAKRKPSPGEPSYNTPARPALRGLEPPPFDKGYEIFEQVLRSIRIRPGAIANQ